MTEMIDVRYCRQATPRQALKESRREFDSLTGTFQYKLDGKVVTRRVAMAAKAKVKA